MESEDILVNSLFVWWRGRWCPADAQAIAGGVPNRENGGFPRG